MMVVVIGLVVVLYPISPTLAPLPVLIRYGSIPCVVPIRHGSIPGAVLESVKGVWYGSCDRYGSIPVAVLIRYGLNPGAVAETVKWGIVDWARDGVVVLEGGMVR